MSRSSKEHERLIQRDLNRKESDRLLDNDPGYREYMERELELEYRQEQENEHKRTERK